ncbi:family 78 glycoside hydrolase catalytic domain [Streptomyces sp. NPDC003247]|uniref:alpha-L-rhamnosidase n=1 Tax=Streptomyces sp. NPDC003247 TaxID=3364677 RepID=UPI0036BD8DED
MPENPPADTSVVVAAPTAEHHGGSLGIGEARPRLSWVTESAPDGWLQTAYEVEISPEDGPACSSGRVESGESVLVAWPEEVPALASRERRTVRVRVWGADGTRSGWSPALAVEAGLLSPGDVTATMITPAVPELTRPALLRTSFELPAPVVRARLYITAHGLYEAEINGLRVGDEVLAPGWSSYHHRLRYATHDVTALLTEGSNAIGAWLGEGWFSGRFGIHGGKTCHYGRHTGLLAQLEVECADGSRVVVDTDERWRAAYGPITFAGLYEGERYDARAELPGWSRPGFDASGWQGVQRVEFDAGTLCAPPGQPVRRVESRAPEAVLTSPSGRRVLDFGQNIAGRVRIRVTGSAGTTITLRHAEVLQDGELYTRPLRHATSADTYVLKGGGSVEEWEPRFTIHGFRYVEVTGWPEDRAPLDVTAQVLHTDMRRTGWFSSSDALLDRLHENVRWSMRGNFVDVPTDCPQRDERLGWTGDIQVFGPTASFLYDCAGFLTSWLADLAHDQYADGTVPFIVPAIPVPEWTPAWAAALWGDAAVLVPWTLYQRFGDRGVLRAQYASARAWVDLVASQRGEDGVWRHGKQLGDWLDPASPPEDPWQARTDPYLVAQAYLARSARVLALIAAELGEDADESRYRTLSDEARAAFLRAFVTAEGRMTSDTQTAYALALRFDLLPDAAARATAGERLAELVGEDGHRIATGFAGTPEVCDALSDTGHDDTAYRLLLQRECPSWLYPVTQGATTVWERWDSMLPDGTVNPGEMTSFNHYALGAVADFLHRVVAGLAPAAPGYRRLRIAPRPGGRLTRADARHLTPYGTAEAGWRLDGGTLTVTATVPPNTTADIDLPGLATTVGSGTHRFEVPWPARGKQPDPADTMSVQG